MRSLEDTAVAFHRACAAAGLPYAVVGGFAVSAWGQPRTTQDIDVLLDCPDPALLPRLVEALAAEGLSVSPADLQDSFADGTHVTVFDSQTSFHVDVKPARREDERREVADAVELPFHGAALRIARPEETIAYKLRFGSDQDLRDARSILVRWGGRLDEHRLRAFARRLGVEEALSRAVAEAEREP